MSFRERILRTGCTLASRLIYGNRAHADWAYEKMQRPATWIALTLNFLLYSLRIPRVFRLTSIVVEPVFGCNLHCNMCWGKIDMGGRRQRLLEWELFCKLVDTMPKYIETITFSLFGEPLLHPRLCEMIDYAAARGFRTTLATNGTLLEGERLDRIACARLDVLNVSFETDADYARETRGIDLHAVRRNIEAFIAAKRPETEVKLYFVARNETGEQIAATMESWKGLVQHIKISPCLCLTDTEGPAPVCIEPWRGNLNVFTNGDVSPCCFDWFNDLTIGNLNGQEFREIIRGEPYRAFLRSMLAGRAPKRCLHCEEPYIKGIPQRMRKRFPKQGRGQR